MNVLEKILEEIIDELKEEGIITDNERGNRAVEIIRSHIDGIPNCEGCSRRKWYQKGFEDGKKDNDWITVEEGLPEEGMGELIVTDKNGNVHMNITYGYAEDSDKEPTFHRWDDEWWQCYKYNVVAWKLKPEPYIKIPK
nr:hypothetical protein [uncultured Faecalimonas sp.]